MTYTAASLSGSNGIGNVCILDLASMTSSKESNYHLQNLPCCTLMHSPLLCKL